MKDALDKDVIVYCATDSGIDGREKTRVLYAELDNDALTARIEKDPSKAWRGTDKRIVNLAVVRKQALAKLDGIEKLALGL